MKTEYKHIIFIKIEDKPQTSVWSCNNKKGGYQLGVIKWFLDGGNIVLCLISVLHLALTVLKI